MNVSLSKRSLWGWKCRWVSVKRHLPCSSRSLNIPRGIASTPNPNKKDYHVHIAYQTTWEKPHIHFSVAGSEWATRPLVRDVVSAGNAWAFARLSIENRLTEIGSDDHCEINEIRFVLTDGGGLWDKASDGSDYCIRDGSGRYLLQNGEVSKVPVDKPGILLVSDLDDTLVGDQEGTKAFLENWRKVFVPAGGRLVYNTGRSLESFQKLHVEQNGDLPLPDVLICSVGTRIYRLSQKSQNKQSSDLVWEEDERWTSHLNTTGWEIEYVREATYKAVAAYGSEKMHFRSPDEMNEHKITLGIHISALEKAVSSIDSSLSKRKLPSPSHRFIVSGSGEWRFVDIVPQRAGKLHALEFVREDLGYHHKHTVACGDSGNDLDMLDGHHHAIVVGNAHEVLKSWALQVPRDQKVAAPLLVNQPRAWGILEGLEALGLSG